MSNGTSRSAKLGGVGVILATLWMAAIQFSAMAGFHPGWFDWTLLAVVLILAVAGVFGLRRLVRLHGEEIGEARFDTRNRDEAGD